MTQMPTPWGKSKWISSVGFVQGSEEITCIYQLLIIMFGIKVLLIKYELPTCNKFLFSVLAATPFHHMTPIFTPVNLFIIHVPTHGTHMNT